MCAADVEQLTSVQLAVHGDGVQLALEVGASQRFESVFTNVLVDLRILSALLRSSGERRGTEIAGRASMLPGAPLPSHRGATHRTGDGDCVRGKR